MVKMNALKTVSISQAEPHVSDVEKDAASTTTTRAVQMDWMNSALGNEERAERPPGSAEDELRM